MTLTLGTRGSQLALTQSRWVASALEAAGVGPVELEVVSTKGDRILDRPLPEIGGKGLFTEELDRHLLAGRIDLAVHSLKDLPTDFADGLMLACVPAREDPRDVMILPPGSSDTVATLAPGARVGTSSTRRRAWLKAFRPDLDVVDVRGNVDTRLRKLDEGQMDALLLAAAGVRRLGLEARVSEWLDPQSWLPAPGQGALGIVARAGDEGTLGALAPLADEGAARAVRAERAFLARLGGGCGLPVGALGMPYDGGLRLRGQVASPDGRRAVRGDSTGSGHEPEALGHELAGRLLEQGADSLLAAVHSPS